MDLQRRTPNDGCAQGETRRPVELAQELRLTIQISEMEYIVFTAPSATTIMGVIRYRLDQELSCVAAPPSH